MAFEIWLLISLDYDVLRIELRTGTLPSGAESFVAAASAAANPLIFGIVCGFFLKGCFRSFTDWCICHRRRFQFLVYLFENE